MFLSSTQHLKSLSFGRKKENEILGVFRVQRGSKVDGRLERWQWWGKGPGYCYKKGPSHPWLALVPTALEAPDGKGTVRRGCTILEADERAHL